MKRVYSKRGIMYHISKFQFFSDFLFLIVNMTCDCCRFEPTIPKAQRSITSTIIILFHPTAYHPLALLNDYYAWSLSDWTIDRREWLYC